MPTLNPDAPGSSIAPASRRRFSCGAASDT